MQWVDRIGRRLKLRDLHILLAVVQHGSMAKAAVELAISQPAVSKAISDMEHVLGVRLLDRARNGIVPTAYGHALAARGRAMFDELKQGVEELAYLADPTVGELRIASTESLAAGFLPAVIETFSREQPRVRLDVAQAVMNAQHYRGLRERSVDLLLGRIPVPWEESDLDVEIVYDDQIVVVASRRSKWARARRVALGDLAPERWVLPPADTMPGFLAAEWFRISGVEMPRASVTTLSIHLCRRLAASGAFVATLPISVLRRADRDELKILPVKLPAQSRPVGVVTLKDRTLSPLAKRFIGCVHRTAKQYSQWSRVTEVRRKIRKAPAGG
jgi:DNA-binding transcriptional LysR family regulator